MANMPDCAYQAKQRALKILDETEKYVTGISENGRPLLYFLIKPQKIAYRELNRAIGEMDNILPQYGDTSAKNEMLELRSMLEDRERILREMLDKK